MLTAKRLAGVAPEVNLRNHVTSTPLPSVNKAEPTLALKPRKMSPEVQNRGISGPTKRTDVQNKVISGLTKRTCVQNRGISGPTKRTDVQNKVISGPTKRTCVQNRGISGPTKRAHVLQKFLKKRCPDSMKTDEIFLSTIY